MAKALPQGMQQFFDANGDPLVAGQVFMYVPSTTTAKDTWQDSAEAVLNANPIVLDANGRAQIFGVGVYRQLVTDADDVTIWDEEVEVFSETPVLWGETSTGTANSQSIALVNGDLLIEAGNPVGGQLVNFMAGYTNTTAMQVTITWPGGNLNGPVELVKSTYLGPAPLEGGEVVDGNLVSMVYDDASGEWYILNAVPVGLTYVPVAFSIFEPLTSMVCPVSLIRAYTLPASTPGCAAYAETIATETVEISIKKNTTTIGTVTFTSGGNTGTIVLSPNADVSFVVADRIVLVFPGAVDDTLAGVSVTFKLQRSING